MTAPALKLNATIKLSAATQSQVTVMPRVVWGTRRSFSQFLELTSVLMLLGSSAAYALFTLSHLA